MGSIILIFLCLELVMAVYYIFKNDRPEHLARMKLLQETVVSVFMVIIVYFCMIGIMALGSNSMSGTSTTFLASVALSLVILIAYSIYVLVWVRPFRLFELYKVNNIVRVIGLVIMASNNFGGIILIDLTELLFFIVDVALYRVEKLNLKLYVIERVMVFIAFNTAALAQDANTILGLAGSMMGGVFLIKLYYTAVTTK